METQGMDYDDKLSVAMHLFAEILFLFFWILIMLQISHYNASVHDAYGVKVNLLNAFSFVSFQNFESLKLFCKSFLMMLIVLGIHVFSIRTVFSMVQRIVSIILIVLNFILGVILVLTLANPILVAAFFVGVIAAAVASTI